MTAAEQVAADHSPQQAFDEKYGLQGSSLEATLGRSAAVGGGQAHDNMPPYIVLHYIIRT